MTRMIDGDELRNQIRHMPRTVNPDLVQYSLVQAIIANMPTLTPQNEWVSVEDALPERGKLVIVCVGGEVTVDTRLMSKTEIIGDWAIHQSREDSITHWMHLPESPYSRPPEGEA